MSLFPPLVAHFILGWRRNFPALATELSSAVGQTCNLSAFQSKRNSSIEQTRWLYGSSSQVVVVGPSIKFARKKKNILSAEISVFLYQDPKNSRRCRGEKRDVDLRDGASVVYLFLCGQLLRLKTCNGLYLHLACWLSWSLCQWQCQQRGSLTSFGTLRIPCKSRVYPFIFKIVT